MVSVMVYPCNLCVTLLTDLCVACFTGFVNCLVNQFAMRLGSGCYFVVECYGSV